MPEGFFCWTRGRKSINQKIPRVWVSPHRHTQYAFLFGPVLFLFRIRPMVLLQPNTLIFRPLIGPLIWDTSVRDLISQPATGNNRRVPELRLQRHRWRQENCRKGQHYSRTWSKASSSFDKLRHGNCAHLAGNHLGLETTGLLSWMRLNSYVPEWPFHLRYDKICSFPKFPPELKKPLILIICHFTSNHSLFPSRTLDI